MAVRTGLQPVQPHEKADSARLSQTQLDTGHCEVCRPSSSRWVDVWCGMPGGWCFSLLRWQCPGKYSGKCWSVSPGSIQHQGSEYP